MKRLHTLGLTLCLLSVFTLSTVQQASAQESKKVVVIKKKTDADGQQTVEKVIMTDEEKADALVNELSMTVPTEVIAIHNNCNKNKSANKDCSKEIHEEVMVNVDEENGEQIITINVDGETETLHLAKGEALSAEDKAHLAEKGVYVSGLKGEGAFIADKIVLNTEDHSDDFDFDLDFDFGFDGLSKGLVGLGKGIAHIGDFNHAFAYDAGDINCAALGVYVSSSRYGGVYINNTIGASGAEEAGLTSGDIIRAIDEYPTNSYGELHDALAKYEPGDVVTVTYSREGVEDRVETQLRAWKDFPSFANSRHALVNCDTEVSEETITRKIIVIKKDKVEEPALPENVNQGPMSEPFDNTLTLTDFVVFPNPTEGKFNIQFAAEAVPTIISVFDASGKEVFRDNLDDFNGYYNREIDLTAHARGALVLSVEQAGKSYTEQIVLH